MPRLEPEKSCEVCHKVIIENLYTMTRTGYRHISCHVTPALDKITADIENITKKLEQVPLLKRPVLSTADIIKIAVETALEEVIEIDCVSSSYREIAISASINAATYIKRILNGIHNYEPPEFIFEPDTLDAIEENPIPDIDAILNA